MAQFPCFPLWTDAWIADTKHLTRCERGTYHDLLVLMWRTPACQVPNDNGWLGKHMGMTESEVVKELRPLINELCHTDGNWVYQKRLKREFAQRFEFGVKQSERAKSRWRKKKSAYRNDAANGIAALAMLPKPSPSTKTDRPSSAAATTVDNSESVAASQQEETDRSLASALPSGALTRDPDSEQAEAKQAVAEKKPMDLTMAEINERWRGPPQVGFRRP